MNELIKSTIQQINDTSKVVEDIHEDVNKILPLSVATERKIFLITNTLSQLTAKLKQQQINLLTTKPESNGE